MSLRVANIAERAVEILWRHGGVLPASVAVWWALPDRITHEHLLLYSDAVSIDCEPGLPRDPRKRQLIRALGLTLIAELAERGEL